MKLTIEELYFTYPGNSRQILKGISASFPNEAITAVTGANGCGKTTLVKNIVGILKPDSGRISLGDSELNTMSLAEIGREVGCVLQNPSCQLFCQTVEQEIAFGLRKQGMEDEKIKQKTDYYLGYFQLDRYRSEFPLHLSQGEKQRLVLAAVLAMGPRYLVLDEPTSSLDIYRRMLLGEYLQKIKKDGHGVILVSHDRAFIEKYADSELVMEDGKIARMVALAYKGGVG